MMCDGLAQQKCRVTIMSASVIQHLVAGLPSSGQAHPMAASGHAVTHPVAMPLLDAVFQSSIVQTDGMHGAAACRA